MPRLNALLDSVAQSDDTAYVLDADRSILRTNPGWSRFALANGGVATLRPWRGVPIDALLPEPLRAFYVGAFERVLATGERWEHDYECSSDETYRRFHMVAYPVDGEFIVVVNSLRVERPHAREAHEPDDAGYAVDGVIRMCSHCRRVRNPRGHQRWDWVPAYVRHPPHNLSHGLCEPCCEYYFGDAAIAEADL